MAFVLWLFYSLSAYYVVQKPFTMPMLTEIMAAQGDWLRFTLSGTAVFRTTLDILTALWLAVVALGTGLWLLTWLRLPQLSPLEEALYAFGLGFGTLGLLTLGLGLLGWLETAVLYTITILLTLAALPKALPHVRRWRGHGPTSRLVRGYLFLVTLLALSLALLPPTSWDALFYHLTGPKLYLAAGQIRPGIDIPHLNFPSLLEMLFMLAMALRGDVAAKLLHFFFAPLLAGLVYVLGKRHFHLRDGWTAVLFLFAAPMTLTLAGWAYNDLALAFYQVAAIAALLQWREQRTTPWLILSGALCGLAMGLKYTSFITPLFLAGVVAWEYRRQWRDGIRPFLTLFCATTLVAAPWYVKNLVFTGNPTYPFVFNGRYWDDFRAAAYAGTGTGIGLDLLALLRLPHDLMLGLRDASADVATGPLFLMFLPLLLVYSLTRWHKRAPAAMRPLLIFVLLQYLFWMLGVISSAGLWQSRLLLPAFVILCPILAWVLDDLSWLDHPQFSLRRFANMTIALALTLGLVSQLANWLPRAPWNYVIGTDSREDVLLRTLGLHYQATADLAEILPPDAVVVFLWEPRSYYCAVDCRPDSILDTFAHLEYLYRNGDAIADAWLADGVTHVLLFQTGFEFVVEAQTERIAPRDMAVWQSLEQERLHLVTDWNGAYKLYEITR
ncbi:MAG: glycosyltransferase family 39 protein [Ardenticatenaceae bacterium]|nr:glycosyltransferase family 39 protein [Ardenticatenaceae bacterium]